MTSSSRLDGRVKKGEFKCILRPTRQLKTRNGTLPLFSREGIPFSLPFCCFSFCFRNITLLVFRPITFLSRLVVLPNDGEQKQVGPFNVSRVPDCCCLIKHSLEMPGKKAFCVINKFLFPPASFVVCGRRRRRRRRGVESIVSSVSGHEDLERTRPRHY